MATMKLGISYDVLESDMHENIQESIDLIKQAANDLYRELQSTDEIKYIDEWRVSQKENLLKNFMNVLELHDDDLLDMNAIDLDPRCYRERISSQTQKFIVDYLSEGFNGILGIYVDPSNKLGGNFPVILSGRNLYNEDFEKIIRMRRLDCLKNTIKEIANMSYSGINTLDDTGIVFKIKGSGLTEDSLYGNDSFTISQDTEDFFNNFNHIILD